MHYPGQSWIKLERNDAKVNKSHQIPSTVTCAAITVQATGVGTINVQTIQDEHTDQIGKCDTYIAIQSPKVIEKCSWSVFAMSGKTFSSWLCWMCCFEVKERVPHLLSCQFNRCSGCIH